MRKGRIAQYKVDQIATVLTVKYRTDRAKLIKELENLIAEEVLNSCTPLIRKFFKKHPELVVRIHYDSYKKEGLNNYMYLHPKAPALTGTKIKSVIAGNPELRKEAEGISEVFNELLATEATRKNQIICAITSLGSYQKLQREFPEAFKILVEQVDKEVITKTTLCDDVEGLRAVLSRETKSINK